MEGFFEGLGTGLLVSIAVVIAIVYLALVSFRQRF